MDNKQARKTGRTVMVCGAVFIVLTKVEIGAIMVAIGLLVCMLFGRCPHCGRFLWGIAPTATNCPKCQGRL